MHFDDENHFKDNLKILNLKLIDISSLIILFRNKVWNVTTLILTKTLKDVGICNHFFLNMLYCRIKGYLFALSILICPHRHIYVIYTNFLVDLNTPLQSITVVLLIGWMSSSKSSSQCVLKLLGLSESYFKQKNENVAVFILKRICNQF